MFGNLYSINKITASDLNWVEFKNYISAWLPESSYIQLQFTIGGLLFVLVAIILWRSRRRAEQVYSFAGTIDSNRQITHILATAIKQHSTFEVQISYPDSEYKHVLSAIFEDIDDTSISLRTQNITPYSSLDSADINCYFMVYIKGRPMHYTFQGIAQHSPYNIPEEGLLVFKIPEQLENKRKRSFLRITPPAEYFVGAAIWHGASMPADSEIVNHATWKKPSMRLLPGTIHKDFGIVDLSAGGIRIKLPKHIQNFQVSKTAILLLELLNPDGRRYSRFWLQCIVQNIIEEHKTDRVLAGLQFTAWAKPKGGEYENIEWLRLGRNNEVDPLSNWIIRRHMELGSSQSHKV